VVRCRPLDCSCVAAHHHTTDRLACAAGCWRNEWAASWRRTCKRRHSPWPFRCERDTVVAPWRLSGD
jgi:hypothetical protein